MTYITTECGSCVKQFYQTDSVLMVQREFRVRSTCKKGPKQLMVERLMKKFEQPGSVVNNKIGTAGRQKCIQTPENTAHI